MLLIILIPVIGILVAGLVTKIFPKAQFKGYDVLPFFFIPSCNLITNLQNRPSFLPYGFLLFFLLAIVLTIGAAVKEKNIALGKTIHKLWGYLSLCSVMWYLGLICMMMA
ncbi:MULTISPECIES: DUF3397 domain-containing protein [Lactobacillus]|uniref:DUF3397 domain-containing protein n=1 Tax=Lactobacillus TaxID=1578 RepID=UPI0024911592|nr:MULTISPECIES: DUF3397 domain-containing protein [Lactobacillus]